MHASPSLQLLDLPGIIEGAAEGKGRGRQVRGDAVAGAQKHYNKQVLVEGEANDMSGDLSGTGRWMGVAATCA